MLFEILWNCVSWLEGSGRSDSRKLSSWSLTVCILPRKEIVIWSGTLFTENFIESSEDLFLAIDLSVIQNCFTAGALIDLHAVKDKFYWRNNICKVTIVWSKTEKTLCIQQWWNNHVVVPKLTKKLVVKLCNKTWWQWIKWPVSIFVTELFNLRSRARD